MSLNEAVKLCWEHYQKFVLKEAWGELFKDRVSRKEIEEQAGKAEEYHQLYEWLFRLKKIAKAVSDYQNGVCDAEETMDIIGAILEEGDGI